MAKQLTLWKHKSRVLFYANWRMGGGYWQYVCPRAQKHYD